jgi:hypothetical protein
VTADEVSAKVAEAEATEREIDATRELYRPVAARASLLFFCIADLAVVDPMYQYSLSWFINLFVRSMEEAPKVSGGEGRLQQQQQQLLLLLLLTLHRCLAAWLCKDVAATGRMLHWPGLVEHPPGSHCRHTTSSHLTNAHTTLAPPPLQAPTVEERGGELNAHFTYSLYLNVCRSLFERHKLMFAFLLAVKVRQAAGDVDSHEWRSLLAGPTAAADANAPANPAPEWLTDKAWSELQALACLPAFKGLLQHVKDNLTHYK